MSSQGNPINPPIAHANTPGTFNPKLIVRNGTGITDQQKKDVGVDFYGKHFTPIDRQSLMDRQRIATIQRENEEEDEEVVSILRVPSPIDFAPPPPPIRRRVGGGGGGGGRVPDFPSF